MDPEDSEPPPIRQDWRSLDKDGEEFKAYYFHRQREVCCFNLNHSVIPGNIHLEFWHSVDDAKKEEILDLAMRGHPLRKYEDLDDYQETGLFSTLCVFAVIGDIIRKPMESKRKRSSKMPQKRGNTLLLKALINNQSRK